MNYHALIAIIMQRTRADSGEVIQALSKSVPSFFGGSADLAGSNKSNVKEATDYDRNTPEGKNIWFGVREFAMECDCKWYGGTWWITPLWCNILCI